MPGGSGAEGAPQAAHRKLHGGPAAAARGGEAGARGGMVRQEDVERVEREMLVLNQARVRLGARIQAPFEAGGLKGCVVRKKAPEKKEGGDKEGRWKQGPVVGVVGAAGLKGGGRHADYFGTLVGESKVKSELKNLVDNNNNAKGCLGDYQTLKLLGSGGSGVVHLVRRVTDDTVWVAKQIKLDTGVLGKAAVPSSERAAHMRRGQRDAVLKEIKLLSQIHSPYVIRFEASYALDNQIFIIMEYAQGGCIGDLIKERKDLCSRFHEDDLWRCVVQVRVFLVFLCVSSVFLCVSNVFLMCCPGTCVSSVFLMCS